MSHNGAIIWLDKTDSTNSDIRRRIDAIDNLTVIAAIEQTSGRGQGNHKWTSVPGQNLTFSVLLDFGSSLDVHRAQTINDIITGALTEYLDEEGVEGTWVKAPNDVWVNDRKIAGILIENILDGEYISKSIVGIGLDLNQTEWPEDLPNPVSLKQLTGRDFDIRDTLARIHNLIEKHYLCKI